MQHDSPDRPTNRLASETSPYLLQHARNPVDWYPWGEEALERARAEDKPIFLSIGYSACHWCHVMERESFESEPTARFMNAHFVNVKVDREERPDLDEIYMKAVQAMTGAGGWPMSVFLTPTLEPFFGGTYFPPAGNAYGRPSFPQVLQWVADRWQRARASLETQGRDMARRIAEEGRARTGAPIGREALDASLAMLTGLYDPIWGGFGDAPKFPHAMDVRILLRHAQRTGLLDALQDAQRGVSTGALPDAQRAGSTGALPDGQRAGPTGALPSAQRAGPTAALPDAPRTSSPDALRMAAHSLRCMAAGGMRDHLGGGFHRYSTDEKWLIPHFEKMLYDNALLVPAYLEGYLVTRDESFARVARECCDWVLREMTTPEGGFASSQDADSEGEEGLYYSWTPAELESVLGTPLAGWAAEWFDVSAAGNFEHGRSALWRPQPAEDVAQRLGVPLARLQAAMDEARAKLLAARRARVPPATDDKVLASWNGLMISACAQTHQVLGAQDCLQAAQRAARYVLGSMRKPDGRLHAVARAGRAHVDACLDDYAFLIQGLLDLYESDFDDHWLREARALARVLTEEFEDGENGGFFTTGARHERLIARLKNPHDGALPSGNGVHALNLLRLAELSGELEWARQAERTITSLGALVNRYPAAFSQLLMAVDVLAQGPREIVIAGALDDARVQALLGAVRGTFAPQRVIALARPGAEAATSPLLAGRIPRAGEVRAYVCRNYTCANPVQESEALRALLRG
jgi:uncharacterized protein YyaL (SSP411 family)